MNKAKVKETLTFFRSVIQSGERWTPTCEEMYASADAALDDDTLHPPKDPILQNLARRFLEADRAMEEALTEQGRAQDRTTTASQDRLKASQALREAAGQDEQVILAGDDAVLIRGNNVTRAKVS